MTSIGQSSSREEVCIQLDIYIINKIHDIQDVLYTDGTIRKGVILHEEIS